MPLTRAYKERRKLPFLKALAHIGTVVGAARSSRISPDAVYGWRKRDASFERAFQHALRRHHDEGFQTLDSAIVFFKDVVRPIIPTELWPRLSAELAIATTNLKHDIKVGGRQHRVASSGEMAEVSLMPRAFEDVFIPNGNGETSAPL